MGLSESLGKETIDLLNPSITKGNNPTFGQNYQKLGKELMSIDELSVMDGSKCILQLRGVRPFLSDKYDITKHKNYKFLSDFKEENAFDMEKFVNHKLEVKPDDKFLIFEADATTEDMPSEAFADNQCGQQAEQPDYVPEDLDAPDFDGFDPSDTELI